ncbi:MAG: RluA family pseudouridine synthase [Bryobacterales bacterium]|nr:RluA family pseudouridine synthase [Bryobacterales bacterium]
MGHVRTAAPEDSGKRLDHFLKQQFPEHSRSLLQEWVKTGQVRVDGGKAKPSLLLRGGERIEVEAAARPPLKAVAEDLPLAVIYEDDAVVAIDKPAGMVVHAGAGVHSGTLVNALLHRFRKLSQTGGELRPGIVHRLDRYTSGVLLVARTDAAHQHLAAQFAGRRVEKTYLALVHGVIRRDSGRITAPIARDPARRVRMTARLGVGRTAYSEFHVLRRFGRFTFLEMKIGTGRTHQIRVHLSSIGHPVVGDTLYGAPAKAPGMPPLGRYFLHAWRIRFESPSTGKPVSIEAKLPPELEAWMSSLL